MLELLIEGMELAVFGMSAVFLLLGCLVLAVEGMSRLVSALGPAAVPSVAAVSVSSGQPAGRELTAVVAAAIHAHRRRGPG